MDWGRAAAFYDWQLPLERPALATALALADPHADDDLLDVGSGTGALLRELARRLPFADGAFAVVTAAYLLHVVDAAERHEIIGECRRVLRAGGRLVTVTPAWPRTRIARLLYAPLAAAAASSSGVCIGLRPLDPRRELEQAAFTIAAATYVGRGYPSLCVLATR